VRFAFTSDQLALRDALREALRGECTPAVVRQSWTTPADGLWRTLADLGVLGVNAPARSGGLGLGPLEWVLLLEEAGRFALPAPLLETLAVAPWLAERREDVLLGQVVRGEALVTVHPEGGYARDADRAALIVAVAPDGVVHALREPSLVAERSVDRSRRLFRVQGPRESLPGDGRAVLDRATLGCAAELLGLGRHVLDFAVAYAKERHQFGRPIGSFQAVQHRLVDALSRLEFAAPVVYRAAWSLASGDPAASAHASMAKAFASEAADFASKQAIQVHGAIGYTTELDLHLWCMRIFALRAAWGDASFHRERVAHALLGGPGA
jgi:alkylation response protein AidB-like acyl-CoA dehydrogenase